jgi:hypothetical protein
MASQSKIAFRLAMFRETARASGWAFGLGLLVLAFAGPLAHEHFYVAEFRKDVMSAVDSTISAQRAVLVRREAFDPAEAAAGQGDKRITVQARILDEGRLQVRAMTSPSAVASYWLPAMIYERQIDLQGSVSEGKWLAGS